MEDHTLFSNYLGEIEMKKDISPQFMPQISTQDDWLNNLQMFDLPQFFIGEENENSDYLLHSSSISSDQVVADTTYKNISNINSNYPNTNANTNSTIDQKLSLSLSVPLPVSQDAQHPAPGPVRQTPHFAQVHNNLSSEKPSNVVCSVTLTREQLLSFTSEDMDDFEKSITATRPLTPAERKEMKRQRRLIKNRESAQLSRRRKKDHVGELEQIVGKLDTINKDITEKLQELESENVILKAEVSQLIGVIRDSPILSGLMSNVASMLVFYALQMSEAKKLPVLQNTHVQRPIEAC